MKSVLWLIFTWMRRSFAAVVLLVVMVVSLMDTTGMQAHEIQHLLAHFYRATGILPDKVVHFLLYFGVCGALWVGFPLRFWGRRSALWAFLFAVGWGCLMEVFQGVCALLGWGARGFDFHDMFANGCGAFVALLLCLGMSCVIERWVLRKAN
ncbi:MAG: hypothetical protein Q4C03_03395 [bacterium]|nr:hypothetical protein [bacterium]